MYRQFITSVCLIILLCLTSISQSQAQCAMCRSTVETNVSYGETSLASGLNAGIIYLFVMPYLLFAVIAFLWYKKSRHHAKKVRVIRYSES